MSEVTYTIYCDPQVPGLAYKTNGIGDAMEESGPLGPEYTDHHYAVEALKALASSYGLSIDQDGGIECSAQEFALIESGE